MTMIADVRPSRASRAFYAIPVIGWIAKDISRGVENVFYALIIALTLLVLAVKVWGVVAITMTALALVPVMFLWLIVISQP
ncbi:hypothetical protein [Neotabrizicola shimadae]|uniref:Uncharacterized protein n=1 Tax=Neotabrizicola shimadae TaxID=2807096 RepID=A0A8G0ZN63_9RHOB|nr:hypothetical protein [Neotabrizicola shimadae]QYZ68431.1 hypothetical protein JO391_11600 [Neotabrizicola shimadae]